MISRRNITKGIVLSAFGAVCINDLSFPKPQKNSMRTETRIFDPANARP
jgi:hypothetical protein